MTEEERGFLVAVLNRGYGVIVSDVVLARERSGEMPQARAAELLLQWVRKGWYWHPNWGLGWGALTEVGKAVAKAEERTAGDEFLQNRTAGIQR